MTINLQRHSGSYTLLTFITIILIPVFPLSGGVPGKLHMYFLLPSLSLCLLWTALNLKGPWGTGDCDSFFSNALWHLHILVRTLLLKKTLKDCFLNFKNTYRFFFVLQNITAFKLQSEISQIINIMVVGIYEKASPYFGLLNVLMIVMCSLWFTLCAEQHQWAMKMWLKDAALWSEVPWQWDGGSCYDHWVCSQPQLR